MDATRRRTGNRITLFAPVAAQVVATVALLSVYVASLLRFAYS
ncbi:hypothetical protein [Halorientalis sp.]|jgi:hypothetical protein|nr:hypothetical protein [Halorientalis sp.]